MKVTRLDSWANWSQIPNNYTGCVIITSNNAQFWFKNGKFHKEDGPAIIEPIYFPQKNSTGVEKHMINSWYLNGIIYSKEKYYKELFKRRLITEQELFIELL